VLSNDEPAHVIRVGFGYLSRELHEARSVLLAGESDDQSYLPVSKGIAYEM
jgi:hypothetical protein